MNIYKIVFQKHGDAQVAKDILDDSGVLGEVKIQQDTTRDLRRAVDELVTGINTLGSASPLLKEYLDRFSAEVRKIKIKEIV